MFIEHMYPINLRLNRIIWALIIHYFNSCLQEYPFNKITCSFTFHVDKREIQKVLNLATHPRSIFSLRTEEEILIVELMSWVTLNNISNNNNEAMKRIQITKLCLRLKSALMSGNCLKKWKHFFKIKFCAKWTCFQQNSQNLLIK